MKELKCPQCGSVFSVDEADYASIVSQVKTQEFEAEIKSRLEEIQKQNATKQEAEALKLSQEFQGKLNSKEIEISKNISSRHCSAAMRPVLPQPATELMKRYFMRSPSNF